MKVMLRGAMAGLVMLVTVMASKAASEEIRFCLSMEESYVVVIESGENCLPEETLINISGGGMKPAEGVDPLAEFSANEDCPPGTSGTRVDVGFDYDGDGKLDSGEVLSKTASCGAE